jgi:hypothetical protein
MSCVAEERPSRELSDGPYRERDFAGTSQDHFWLACQTGGIGRRKVEMDNIMAEGVSPPGRDIVEGVCREGPPLRQES